MKKCNICESTKQVCFNNQTNQLLCARHRYQLNVWGEIRRTIYDPNEIIIKDNYAEVCLYNKNGEEIARAIIDIEDVGIVKKHKWKYDGYYCSTGGSRTTHFRLHRYVMNNPKNMEVDHINGNKLDNRKENLRICTRQENAMNLKLSKVNKSGKTGVDYDKKLNKWRVRIKYKQKEYSLGYFENKNDAIKARIEGENKFFKEFKSQNNMEF